MAYGIWRLYLLLIIAAGYSQGQRTNFYDPSEILFPGETERPSKFPLYPETTTPSPVYKTCFKYCETTSEYDPVCGDDNIVYSNPGRLQCARDCGKDVKLVKYGQCKLHNPRGPESNGPTSTPSSGIIYGQCLNSCLSSDEYNPVCGTDGIVYSNIEKLRCAQDCGKEVDPGRCVDDSRG